MSSPVSISPIRLRRDRSLGWRKPAGSVIVDRTSRWGNPWGWVLCPESRTWYVCRARSKRRTGHWRGNPQAAQRAAVAYFCRWLTLTPSGRALATRAREQLQGYDLVCWCFPDDACHADVLLEVANAEEEAS